MSALQPVDFGSISVSGHTKGYEKTIFTDFLLGALHKSNSTEKKPTSLLVVPSGKALDGIPPSFYGRQC